MLFSIQNDFIHVKLTSIIVVIKPLDSDAFLSIDIIFVYQKEIVGKHV